MALRQVTLTGTAQLNILVGNAASYEGVIQQALENQGFSINSVRIIKQLLSTFTNNIGITIDCNVDTQYSGEEARASAQQVLSNITGESWAYYDSNLLSDVNLKILSDNSPNTTKTDSSASDLPNLLNSIGKAATDIAKESVKGSLEGAGVTVPIVIGVVVIAAFLFFGPRHR